MIMAANQAYAAYKVGEWTYGDPTILSWDEGSTFSIGRFCSISANVAILLGGEHRTDWVTTYPFNIMFKQASHFTGHPRTRGDVCIGNDVWIGRDVTVLSGVVIGDGAVVGACSLVTKDVAPYTIVGGNPARHIKDRFPADIKQALLDIAWWNWPQEDIEEAWPLLLSSDIEAFIYKYRGCSQTEY